MSEALTLLIVYVVSYAFVLALIFSCVRYDDKQKHQTKNKHGTLDDGLETKQNQEEKEMETLKDKINEMAFYLECAHDEMDKIGNELVELGADKEKILRMTGLSIGVAAILAINEGKNAFDLYEDFAYLIFKGADENDEDE